MSTRKLKGPSGAVRSATGVAALAMIVAGLGAAPLAAGARADGTPKQTADATVSIVTSSGVSTLDFREESSPRSLGAFLSEKGVDPSTVRTQDSKTIDQGEEIRSGTSLTLYSVESSSVETTSEVPYETDTVPSDGLYVGETEVQQEGEPGSLVTTTTTSVDLSKDPAVNPIATSGADKSTVDTRTTVTKQPTRRVVLEGTRPRPEPEPEEAPVEAEATDSGVALTDDASQSKAVQLALSKVGSPYVWGAAGPGAFDCSGLVTWVYRTNLGYDIPRTAADQLAHGKRVGVDDLKPGMLLASTTHIVIYIGGGQVVHASTPATGVRVDSLSWALSAGLTPITF